MIDNASDFVDANTFSTGTTSYLVANPQPATTFYWRVRAVRGGGLNTHWSEARSYTIGPLPEVHGTVLGEAAGAVEDIVFDWEPVAGAKDYELRISTDSDFNTLVPDNRVIVVKSTRYSPPVTFNNNQYWWQVRARDNAGNTIPWTDARVPVRQFQRHWPDIPGLEYPADSVSAPVGDPFFFQWTPVDHASKYQLEMGTTASFSDGTYETCYTRATTYTPGFNGPNGINDRCTPRPGQVYYWRVRALDEPGGEYGKGINGIWSEIRAFVYDPGLVTPSAPADGATVAVPTLRWEAARDADQYSVVIRNAYGQIVASTKTYSLSWTPTTKLDPTKSPYRWSVTSIDRNGHESSALMIGDQRTFSLAGTPSSSGRAPFAPLEAEQPTARFPALHWEPHSEAAYYKLYIGVQGAPTLTEVTNTKFAYPAATDISKSWLSAGAYDWVVEGYRSDNSYIGRSGTRGTFTIDHLPPVEGQQVALTGTALADNACSRELDATGTEYCKDLTQTPVLDWEPVPGAGHYMLYLYQDRELTNPVYREPSHLVTTQNTRWTPTELLPDSQAGHAYFWFVRPCKTVSVCANDPVAAGHAFDKRSRQIAEPAVLNASNGVVSNELVLDWKDALSRNSETPQSLTSGGVPTAATFDAKQYRVQISDDPTFVRKLKEEVVDQSTYTPYALTFPEGPLYWRVQAIDGTGNSLTWSEPQEVLKKSDRVTPKTPTASSVVSGTPYFSWSPEHFASGYDVEVYKNGDTTLSLSNRVISASSKQAALTPNQPLPTSSQSYVWRVRRLDADNKPGQWSPLRSLTVAGQAPRQVAPVSSAFAKGTDAHFAWKAVAGATTYYFERRRDGAGYSDERITTYAQSWAPMAAISDGRHEWRVSSVDSQNRTIASTGWRTFYVDSKRPSVTRRLPASSPRPRRDANWTATFSEPVKRVNSTTMRLYRAGRSQPVLAKISVSNGGRTWTLNPSSLMSSKVKYTLKLSSGIIDRAGNTLPATSYSRTVR